MTKFNLSAVALFLGASSFASATFADASHHSGWYASIGVSSHGNDTLTSQTNGNSDSVKSAVHPAFTIGKRLNEHLSVELHSVEMGGDLTRYQDEEYIYHPILLRARYEINTSSSQQYWNPYVGVGVGQAKGTASFINPVGVSNDHSLATQLFVGNKIRFANHWYSDIEAGYTRINDQTYTYLGDQFTLEPAKFKTISIAIGKQF